MPIGGDCLVNTSIRLVVGLLIFAGAAQCENLYSATPLGSLGGNTTSASAINDSGQVTGFSEKANGFSSAFLYSNGMLANLGRVGGAVDSQGNAINNAGQIVGVLGFTGFALPFMYSNGVMSIVSAPNILPGRVASAVGINDSGEIIVTATTPFVSSNGDVTALEFQPSAINNVGQITGSNTAGHAVLYQPGGTVADLGALPGDEMSMGRAISNLGEVVGVSYASNSAGGHAFVYSNGVMTDIGTLSGDPSPDPLGVNDQGQVVGTLSNRRAFLYSDGVMTDLNSLVVAGLDGFALTSANGINDSGQIIANGTNGSREEAFLLTPAAVPEPSSLSLVALGSSLVLCVFRRSKRLE
jgi:probable HAF family extracellular repeat protein